MARPFSAGAGIVAGIALALLFPAFSWSGHGRWRRGSVDAGHAVPQDAAETVQLPRSVREAQVPHPDTQEERFSAAMERHRRAPQDARWSAGAEATLTATLATLPDGSGAMGTEWVDCRIESCVASVTWPAHAPVQQDVAALLRAAYRPNCGVAISTPPPEDEDAGYRASILFDCAEAKEAQAL